MTFFEDLKRRNVFKVGAAYLIGTQDLSAFATELDTIQGRREKNGMVPLKTVRTLSRVDVSARPYDPALPKEYAGREFVIEVEGAGFANGGDELKVFLAATG